ncbi:calexcitin-2-like [Uranotaenia lowii]|uniref:calexcitin-2-like n=1 Tax=Uranotaenia lowii TaxID=190385 RepID=UPI0024797084|nr:calexcitin-2-like [Uranotaenia lowii]XP_055588269.1 calexcitin-2-like [Uranotaenia lowii]XP_055588271.1 calexcitin-2-like [Uranotaenia lowii]XP_055588272.1 calexcitin-2-like [Uranotaenia lowii]
MSISEFRKKKLLYVFNVFFDVNQSGEIDQKDFEMAIEKICELRGWPAGNSRNTETHETMLKIWEGLRAKADKDNDGQVSVDEWYKMWDEYARNPESVLDWQIRYMNFMFDLEDASTDGSIDAEEFATVCSSYGLDKQECVNAFEKMARGNEEVDRDQFAELWREYFSSDDPSSPGNCIFGKTSF